MAPQLVSIGKVLSDVLVPVLSAFVLAAVGAHYLARPHVAVAILDHPNERSLHVRPTPRTGGLALLSGWFVPVGPGLNRRTLVYDKDVAAAAILAVEHPAAGGRVYNVTDGHVHRFCEII